MDERLLRTFQFLGLDCSNEAGGVERPCTCPKCMKEDHLYWNINKQVGFCHHCISSFSIHMMLNVLLAQHQDSLTPHTLKRLAMDRGLPVDAFRGYGIAYIKGYYIIPIYDFKSRVVSIRRYRPGKPIMIMAGLPASLFGAEQFDMESSQNKKVYVCEGEWDAIALRWYFKLK